MSKTCENCDHYCACSKWYGFDEETGEAVRRNGGCWSGWHDVKEELPEVGEEVIVYCKDGKNALVSMNENKFWKFDIGNIATDYVIAWRELPEYEVK